MITYVINLDRRSDKWAWVRERIAEQGIKIIRFTAIDTKPGWIGCRESHLDIMVKCYGEKEFIKM